MYNYESQEHYELEMNAQGYAEGEAQAAAYEEYLQAMLDNKEYYLWALYVIQDGLQSKRFKDSKQDAVSYLETLKQEYYDKKNKPKEPVKNNSVDEDLPF